MQLTVTEEGNYSVSNFIKQKFGETTGTSRETVESDAASTLGSIDFAGGGIDYT